MKRYKFKKNQKVYINYRQHSPFIVKNRCRINNKNYYELSVVICTFSKNNLLKKFIWKVVRKISVNFAHLLDRKYGYELVVDNEIWDPGVFNDGDTFYIRKDKFIPEDRLCSEFPNQINDYIKECQGENSCKLINEFLSATT